MSKRDPRLEPRSGDVFRWTESRDGAENPRWIVCVANDDDMFTVTADGRAPEWRRLSPERWRDWSMVDGGIDGVTVLFKAEGP